jgi:short-subunit dehydrogenase
MSAMKSERVIVITGASSGIGAALAKHLGSRGDRVVLAARRGAELAAVAASVGSAALAVTADVTHRDQVERLRDRAIDVCGGIDVWINNAGQGISRPVLELSDDDIDRMMAVNVKSALYGIQAAVPHFVERGRGHIINVSSVLSRVPMAPLRSMYSAAKAALNSLTANLRTDLAATHPEIHVTLVMPGLVSTDFPKHAIGGTPPYRPAPAPGGPGGHYPSAQSAEEVAEVIAGVIGHPVAEVYTNASHSPIVERYFQDVGAFERAQRSS